MIRRGRFVIERKWEYDRFFAGRNTATAWAVDRFTATRAESGYPTGRRRIAGLTGRAEAESHRLFVTLLSQFTTMDRIVLEVDDSAANAYRAFTEESRERFNRIISLFLKKATNDQSSEEYSRMLDDMGTEAARNGLTPEILGKLMESDD